MSKINNNKINQYQSLGSLRKNETKRTEKTNVSAENKISTRSEDQVKLSGQASEVGKLVDRLNELPDVREAKVSALREKIKTGEYNPSNEEIAGAILKEES